MKPERTVRSYRAFLQPPATALDTGRPEPVEFELCELNCVSEKPATDQADELCPSSILIKFDLAL